MQPCSSLSILWHCLSLGLGWKLIFSSPVATAKFSKFAGILSVTLSECKSFRIWNSAAGIPSSPLVLFVVMLPKAYLTSHSRMSGSRWVITPLWYYCLPISPIRSPIASSQPVGSGQPIGSGHRVKPLSLLSSITLSPLLAACRHSVMWGVFLLSFWCPRLSGLWTEHQNIQRPHRRAWGYRHAKSLQLCWIPRDCMDCSPLGSSVHGISQARILEWVAKPSSSRSSWPRDWTRIPYVSCISRWGLYH